MTTRQPRGVEHRFRWFVYAGRERLPRTAIMRGAWGYDAVCSCSYDTNTGGATRGYIEGLVWLHKEGYG